MAMKINERVRSRGRAEVMQSVVSRKKGDCESLYGGKENGTSAKGGKKTD